MALGKLLIVWHCRFSRGGCYLNTSSFCSFFVLNSYTTCLFYYNKMKVKFLARVFMFFNIISIYKSVYKKIRLPPIKNLLESSLIKDVIIFVLFKN